MACKYGAVRPWAVDVSSGVEEPRASRTPRKIHRFCAAVRAADESASPNLQDTMYHLMNYQQPDARGHFGPVKLQYGGSFVAETLTTRCIN
jgi:hypothetical protein